MFCEEQRGSHELGLRSVVFELPEKSIHVEIFSKHLETTNQKVREIT